MKITTIGELVDALALNKELEEDVAGAARAYNLAGTKDASEQRLKELNFHKERLQDLRGTCVKFST